MSLRSLARGAAFRGPVSVLAVGAATASAAVALAVHALPAGADASSAVSAFDMIDSVGVNVHMYFQDTTYADTKGTISLLSNLGVRHVRDMMPSDRPDQVTSIQQLGAAGIRTELVLNGVTTPTGAQVVDPPQIDALSQVAPTVDGVEPANEYDCWGGTSWAPKLRSFAQQLTSTIRANSQVAGIPMLAPSFCRPDSVAVYGAANDTADAANGHDYASSLAPELAVEARVPSWQTAQRTASPMVLTETGYNNALNVAGSVKEATAADYLVRTLLDAKRIGVQRTYLYELRDERPEAALQDAEQHYGLVRADGTLKPAYTAVANLLSDLARGKPADVTASAPTSAAPVTVAGGGSLVRSLVVTDPSGGGQTVALWLARPLEDWQTHAVLPDTARAVRVTVPTMMSATTQQPSRGNAVRTLGSGTGFTVPINGAVTLLHLAPSTATQVTSACSSQSGYLMLAKSYGATVSNALSPTTASWSSPVPAATDLPAALTSAVQLTSGQVARVPVPGRPTAWTVALWERTDAGSASFAPFLKVVDAPAWAGLMRTYDLTSDVPSHVQVDAYGLPPKGLTAGAEIVGQARPGTWHLLSLTVNGTTVSFGIDGVQVGAAASGSTVLTGIDVGSASSGFRGSVGGLTVFNTALTVDRIQQLATAAPVSC